MDEFLNWHYRQTASKITTAFYNLYLFPIYFFSVPLHLKTLFSPWKRQIVAKKAGFRLDNIMSVIAFNLTSSMIGLIVRLTVIAYGLVLSLLLPLLFLPVILIWPLIPFLSYPFYLNRQTSPEEQLTDLLKQDKLINQIKKFCQSIFGKFILLRLGLNPLNLAKKLTEDLKSLPPASSIEEFFTKIVATPPFSSIFQNDHIKSEHFHACWNWYKE
ncbi:hypothetical protein A2W14_01515, partial [Candidatus Gottesmanbacteria bacterium RBG_16_37_8]